MHISLLTHLAAPLQAEKRRESMALGMNKTKEQLSSAEQRVHQLSIDVQRLQMDMMAKSGACRGKLHRGCHWGCLALTRRAWACRLCTVVGHGNSAL